MEPLQLKKRCLGGDPKDPPLVILHGMLGSSRNWATAGTDLASGYHVWAVDLRNHGSSPHHPLHTYEAMAADLEGLRREMDWETMVLLGHSMGGKAAMRYACDNPKRVSALIVVDISPVDHKPYHAVELAALKDLPLPAIGTRKEADELLSKAVPDWAMRQFLLTNLRRSADGWQWQVNLEALTGHLADLARSPLSSGDSYLGPTLFVRGGQSDFVPDEDIPQAREYFPNSQWQTIPQAGHNVHVEARPDFARMVTAFLQEAKEGGASSER